ncbi:Wadjet anti-phage system protein JetD domain-containing protein [Georgenia sp. AZ-5]|uniref:Wadjet anti-phage system protein JetD domain-containing protein n=1 Tax=Georgenia sp. AZ-5 TaxID=3367526 RepID=UPI003754EF50
MVGVAEVREEARKRYDRLGATWAIAAATGGLDGAALLDRPLHAPTEAAALADQAGAVAWVRSWREAGVPGVRWARRRWASVGAQDVPERVRLEDPALVAELAGRARHWRDLSGRVAALLEEWPAVEAVVRRHARAVAALPGADFARLQEVLRWLVAHPRSGRYIRQLPVRGVDTKWVERHRGLVAGLFGALTGSDDLGLARPPELVRVRFLDAALAPGGLVDVSAPIEQLDALPVRPRTVFVFENLESVVAMPAVPGAVVVHGGGYAVDRLARIGWVSEGRVLYWGDLDSHGFAILDQLRTSCPQAESVLMDLETLEAHRDLWVPEPAPSRAALTRLTPEEAEVLARLRAEGDVRLEQERLDWAPSVQRLVAIAVPV